MLRRRTRSGISLLEVVFSIGVVMIGLVGIAALLPVAGSQANKGAVADSAARLGADAVREFHVRSMGNPSAWRWFDGIQLQFRRVTPAELMAGNSFCLDPRFVAQGTADHAGRSRFPYIDPGTVLSMPRITLTPSPGALDTAVMLRPHADQVFTSGDGLVFDLPGDRTLGPVQNFSLAPVALFPPPLVPPPLRRNTNGHISWLATIVPKLDRMGNLTDEYTLSVVVFSRRIIDDVLTNLGSERVVEIPTVNFYSGQPAIGGGDLRLVTRRNDPDDLELRSGDWVMLSATKERPGMSTIQVHKWYRVANAGEESVLASPGVWARDVTLTGPDWDWLSNRPSTTQVTIARGAAAVFEKTIRLETSSLWTY
ncbi:MAG: type IV pilus modification PilV family protein [Pirellulaceae bacterium]